MKQQEPDFHRRCLCSKAQGLICSTTDNYGHLQVTLEHEFRMMGNNTKFHLKQWFSVYQNYLIVRNIDF